MSIARPWRSLVVVSSISCTTSLKLAASLSTAPVGREVPVRDVDRDALLALGAQAVGQQGEVERAVRSLAGTLEDVVAEIAATRITERGETRADDRVSEAAMEDRKREGYF